MSAPAPFICEYGKMLMVMMSDSFCGQIPD